MAKVLKEWTFATMTTRQRFARYCASIIDVNARMIENPPEMMIYLGDCLVGDVYNLETRRKETRMAISIKHLSALRFDDDSVLYCAVSNKDEEYYFSIWQSTDDAMKDLVRTWLKNVSSDDVLTYMRSE